MTTAAGHDEAGDPLSIADTPHVLVVDDDERLRALLTRYLSDNGFVVTAAGGAEEARAHLSAVTFDLLVVDVMMPGEDGVSLTRALRETSTVPILMLTAMGDPEARIRGLEAGADDYLGKPFEPRELLLRINGILRRVADRTTLGPEPEEPPAAPPVLRFGALALDLRREALSRDGEPVRLTTTETQLLMVLARQAGEVIARDDLAEQTGTAANPRGIDVQVTRLRRKLEPDPRVPRYLQTVRGRGYLLRPD
ncbi:response regulator [Roseospira marina]|uniref:Response regulator n=1 Tax=Roseospira marina TaxID=140057 RepID=A0A5M6IFA4_9PROT|nr:response regulator [Roseospira marina]KAA5606960.1 response regulator [Roseospira marina]MBB4312862.1 two-component system phosphate regulon response regulator OmpR [Roseospira marina]MBB5086365.1 two-component system phosphate regulon response regulator OmpR [Roseospira marina]